VEVISLHHLLKTHCHIPDDFTYLSAIDAVDVIRQREYWLRQFIPLKVIRNIIRGLARSNTVHPDTAQALYNICRAIKTDCVFETGTYWGYSTAYLAAALEDIGNSGKVYTFDLYSHAGKYIPKNLRSRVELHRGQPSTEMMPKVLEKVVPDLFFQDSLHDYEGVKSELEIVAPYLKPGAIILFHDFVEPNVQRAAIDVLQNYAIYVIDTQDPQQLGCAVKI
jgi:predicted O-methyltransferase YrrM